MACVTACPDTAILGTSPSRELAGHGDRRVRRHAGRPDAGRRRRPRPTSSHTTKYADVPGQARASSRPTFGIFIDPAHCKGCAECVEVCAALDHDALVMVEKCRRRGRAARARSTATAATCAFFRSLPPTPVEYRNEKALADLMLGEHAFGYVGGAGSCSGCGEATAIRMIVAATRQVHGPQSMGIVAATGCNTVYGSTYPYNPYLVPWTNSLFENAPADAHGHPRCAGTRPATHDRRLWVIGGDGAMYDIGFQSLSRMVASGMDIKVLVLDTQVYSNTGGQASTATFAGQVTKLSAFGKALHGKRERRKELGRILMAHGEAYVAQTTAAHINHFYRAVMEANEFPGPAVIIAYTTCQPEHGVGDDAADRQARLAVDSRAFPLFIYDPRRGELDRRAAVAAGQPGGQGGLVEDARTGRRSTSSPSPAPRAASRQHFGGRRHALRRDPGHPGRPPGQLAHAPGAGRAPLRGPALRRVRQLDAKAEQANAAIEIEPLKGRESGFHDALGIDGRLRELDAVGRREERRRPQLDGHPDHVSTLGKVVDELPRDALGLAPDLVRVGQVALERSFATLASAHVWLG